jgi:hypothetical protein
MQSHLLALYPLSDSDPGGRPLDRIPQTEESTLPIEHQVSFDNELRAVDHTQAVCGSALAGLPSTSLLLDQYDVEIISADGVLGVSLIIAKEILKCVCKA